jgi:hypothetical protein
MSGDRAYGMLTFPKIFLGYKVQELSESTDEYVFVLNHEKSSSVVSLKEESKLKGEIALARRDILECFH